MCPHSTIDLPLHEMSDLGKPSKSDSLPFQGFQGGPPRKKMPPKLLGRDPSKGLRHNPRERPPKGMPPLVVKREEHRPSSKEPAWVKSKNEPKACSPASNTPHDLRTNQGYRSGSEMKQTWIQTNKCTLHILPQQMQEQILRHNPEGRPPPIDPPQVLVVVRHQGRRLSSEHERALVQAKIQTLQNEMREPPAVILQTQPTKKAPIMAPPHPRRWTKLIGPTLSQPSDSPI